MEIKWSKFPETAVSGIKKKKKKFEVYIFDKIEVFFLSFSAWRHFIFYELKM